MGQQKMLETTLVVTEEKTARHMGSGDLAVLATPAMVAAMENAAMQLAAGFLEQGQTTVGVHINVEHNKASAIGAQITARATLVEAEGRRYRFMVEAFENGEQIGVGEHTRVAVNSEKFMSKLG